MQTPANDPKPEETIFPEEEFSMEGYDKHIRNARIILFVVAALQLIPLINLGRYELDAKIFLIGVSVLSAAIFAGLAFWTKQKPFIALLIALVVYAGLIILNVVLGGAQTILTGIIFKVIIIVSLVLGLRNAKEADDMKKMYGRK